MQWQRYYAGSWWNIPVELNTYTSGQAPPYLTSPLSRVQEEELARTLGIRAEAALVDSTGRTFAAWDSTSIGPLLDAFATLWYPESDIGSLVVIAPGVRGIGHGERHVDPDGGPELSVEHVHRVRGGAHHRTHCGHNGLNRRLAGRGRNPDRIGDRHRRIYWDGRISLAAFLFGQLVGYPDPTQPLHGRRNLYL